MMFSLLTPLLEKLLLLTNEEPYRCKLQGNKTRYLNGNHNASGRQCSADCLWHSLNCL